MIDNDSSGIGPERQPTGRASEPGVQLCGSGEPAADPPAQLQHPQRGQARLPRPEHHDRSGPISQPAQTAASGHVRHQRASAGPVAQPQPAAQARSAPVPGPGPPQTPRTGRLRPGNGRQEGLHAPQRAGDAQTQRQRVPHAQSRSVRAADEAQVAGSARQSVELRLPSGGPARLAVGGQSQLYADAVPRAAAAEGTCVESAADGRFRVSSRRRNGREPRPGSSRLRRDFFVPRRRQSSARRLVGPSGSTDGQRLDWCPRPAVCHQQLGVAVPAARSVAP